MSLVTNKTFTFKGSAKKLITADITFGKYEEPIPIVVFAHGFKGFKDWGSWPLAAEIFGVKSFPFFKFNFSHNGTTPKSLTEFKDLEAFGNNNFKIEYDDLGLAIDFISKKSEELPFDWNGEIYVIGHSRGGAIALLRTSKDPRITKCATWGSVFNIEKYIHLKDTLSWQAEGVHYIVNGRTKQQMPIYFQFVENYVENKGLFDMEENLDTILSPILILHGEKDDVVGKEEAMDIYNTIEHSIFIEIENGDHTFNTKHPTTERKIPKPFADAILETIEFFSM